MAQQKQRRPPATHPPSVKLLRIWHHRLRDPLLTCLLILQIFILFVMPCLRDAGLEITQNAIYLVLLSFVAMAIVSARSRNAIAMIVLSLALTVTGLIWRHEKPDLFTDFITVTGQGLTLASLIWVVSQAVFSPGRASYHRILGAVVMYLSIGMLFLDVEIFLAREVPNAFSHLPKDPAELREAMTYFSFGALTTGAFGDIVPIHPIARALVNIEEICGQLFPATLLARIVSLHASKIDDKARG